MKSWQPQPVLIRFQPWNYALIQPPPRLIVFANGLVVVSEWSEELGYLPYEAKLERAGLCSLLNTIDRFGFFDDEEVYLEPLPEGPGSTFEVNAWATKRIDEISLGCWIIGDQPDPSLCCNPDVPCEAPVIKPSWESVYKFLEQYRPEALQPVPVENIMVVVTGDEMENFEAYEGWPSFEKWPFPDISLADLHQQLSSNLDSPLVITGDDAINWHAVMPNGIYRDGDFIARVASRPLWPYEIPSRSSMFMGTEEADLDLPNITCYPEDGWLQPGQ